MKTKPAAMLVAALMVCGCGGGPELATITGKVTYNGEPIKKGRIFFEPTVGRAARGMIIDGEIRDLHTYKPGDGVRGGDHRISVIAFVREPVGMEVPPSLIPEKYGNPASSGLTAIVELGKPNVVSFDLTD